MTMFELKILNLSLTRTFSSAPSQSISISPESSPPRTHGFGFFEQVVLHIWPLWLQIMSVRCLLFATMLKILFHQLLILPKMESSCACCLSWVFPFNVLATVSLVFSVLLLRIFQSLDNVLYYVCAVVYWTSPQLFNMR